FTVTLSLHDALPISMRNAKMGGSRVHYFEPAELDRTPRPTASAPPRIPGRRFDASTHEKVLAIAEAAGFRERAMQRQSILITNGDRKSTRLNSSHVK